MRNPRKEKFELEYLLPLIIPQAVIDAGDCMGKEYDPKNKDCSVCADQALCANYFQQLIQIDVKRFEEEKGPFLDQVYFGLVKWDKIERLVDKYAADDAMTFEELVDLISTMARCSDEMTVLEYIKIELPKTNLDLKEGYVIKRKN